MDFSVKTIFKVLIGTIAVMVFSSLIIEYVNLTVVSLRLTNVTKVAARQSAVLFSQETYKRRASGGGAVELDNISALDGTMYVSGDIYPSSVPETMYDILYTNSSEYRSWLNTYGDYWDSTKIMKKYLFGGVVSLPSNPLDSVAMQNYTDYLMGKSYAEGMMTPLNIGVPYLDRATVDRMFKWNLTEILSDCGDESIIRADDAGNNCIYFDGFRVYADLATITNIEYRVYNILDPDGADDFNQMTGMDPSVLIDNAGSDANERMNIMVVGIEYSVPVAFEGVTPIRRIAEFIWNYEVEGITGEGGPGLTGEHWNDAIANLESGGFEGPGIHGGLPVPGKLIYYIVR